MDSLRVIFWGGGGGGFRVDAYEHSVVHVWRPEIDTEYLSHSPSYF